MASQHLPFRIRCVSPFEDGDRAETFGRRGLCCGKSKRSRAENAVLKIIDFDLSKNLSGGDTVRPLNLSPNLSPKANPR